DSEKTEEARRKEREDRKKRGIAYQEFVKNWVTDTPPANLPFYGSWKEKNVIYAGSPDNYMTEGNLKAVWLPNPKDVRIAELETELKELGDKR
ncbi:MAG TPA: acetone carboxylase subunit alpha, partial [Paenibacillaceae bacterium]|nr:acetone carboxylase subunit alpha [Paenibacillaceae bacterium]